MRSGHFKMSKFKNRTKVFFQKCSPPIFYVVSYVFYFGEIHPTYMTKIYI